MQVNSVSNSFNTPFKASLQEQAFANLNDNDLKNIAYNKASKDVNDRKHHRIDKALYYALPLAAGLGAAVRKYTPEAVSAIGQKNMRALRLRNFGMTTIGWAAGLAAINAVWGLRNVIANSSQKAKDFFNNSPVLTTIATLAAGFGAVLAVDKYGYKALGKVFNLIEKKGLSGKVLEKAKIVRDALNSSKILNKASGLLAKVPAPIKEIGRTAAEWGPWIVVGTQLAHSFGHQNVKAREVSNDYEQLKEAQTLIRDDLADEKINKDLEEVA